MSKISNIFVGYHTIQILCALEKTGIITYLQKHTEGTHVQEICKDLSLDSYKTEAALNFLSLHIPEFFQMQKSTCKLSERFFNSDLQNALNFTYAYEPIMNGLDLRSQNPQSPEPARERDGLHLGISSALHNKRMWEDIIDVLRHKNITTVIDIGCSIGEFIIFAKSELPNIKFYGVDVDKKAVQRAQENLNTGNETHTKIFEGDAGAPMNWKNQLGNISLTHTAFVGITIWHELLSPTKHTFINAIKTYKNLFPGALFIMAEQNGYTYEELSLLPETLKAFSSIYQLVHPLTGQGMPQSPNRWKMLFEAADCIILDTKYVEPDMSMYVAQL